MLLSKGAFFATDPAAFETEFLVASRYRYDGLYDVTEVCFNALLLLIHISPHYPQSGKIGERQTGIYDVSVHAGSTRVTIRSVRRLMYSPLVFSALKRRATRFRYRVMPVAPHHHRCQAHRRFLLPLRATTSWSVAACQPTASLEDGGGNALQAQRHRTLSTRPSESRSSLGIGN